MNVKNLTDGASFYANTYLAISGNEAALIDASVPASELKRELLQEGAELKYIILTHGHYDHVVFLDELRETFRGVPVLSGAEETKVLTDSEANVSSLFGNPHVFAPADKVLTDGERIALSGAEFVVLTTPGHTPGSICLLEENEKIMFTGDTLFSGGIGRTDFKYGSYSAIMSSLSRLGALDESIRFYPGHGCDSIIGWEF